MLDETPKVVTCKDPPDYTNLSNTMIPSIRYKECMLLVKCETLGRTEHAFLKTTIFKSLATVSDDHLVEGGCVHCVFNRQDNNDILNNFLKTRIRDLEDMD